MCSSDLQTHTHTNTHKIACDIQENRVSSSQEVPWNSRNLELYCNVLNTLRRSKNGINFRDFPGGAVVKNPPANAGDTGLSPGPGRSHMPRSN